MKTLELGDKQAQLLKESLDVVIYLSEQNNDYFGKAEIHKLKTIRTKLKS